MNIGHPEGKDLRKDVIIWQGKGNLVNIQNVWNLGKQIFSWFCAHLHHVEAATIWFIPLEGDQLQQGAALYEPHEALHYGYIYQMNWWNGLFLNASPMMSSFTFTWDNLQLLY